MDGTPSAIRYPWSEPPAEGEAIEVAPGVLWLRLPLPMKLDHVNIFALDDGDGWTIVDTGFCSKSSKAIWQKCLDGPLGGRPVNRVVVTHHHPDHVGLAGWFQSEHGAELMTTRTAWLMARMKVFEVEEHHTEETLAFWRGAGMDPAVYQGRVSERPFNFADVVAPMPLGFTRVKQGDVVHFGGRDWDVRIGHGHAPEHATFWSRDDNLVLGGDQLLPSISPNLGVYATEPDADPVGEWLDSCEGFIPFADGEQLVLPGHKLPYTGLPTRLNQLITNHHSALTRLLKHLETPQSAGSCFMPLFKREISGGEYGLALVESIGHLNHLYHLGRVNRWRGENDEWLFQVKEVAGD